jgi:DNA-directed RNA polymerase subunit RPC12/RpoP
MASDVDVPAGKGTRRLQCPRCQQLTMRRIKRSGFLQKNLLTWFGYYPWECAICRLRKLIKDRGTSKRSHSRPD